MKQSLFVLVRGVVMLAVMALCLGAADELPVFSDIGVEQAARLLKEKAPLPGFYLIDVRTPQEFADGRIPGAVNVDVRAADFEARIKKYDKAGIYLVYCRGGVRSADAMRRMRSMGFATVYNLGGGILKWREAGLPWDTRSIDGQPGQATTPLPEHFPMVGLGAAGPNRPSGSSCVT